MEKKKQLGNTVRYGTTVTPFQDALVKGLSISITGERATRGSIADFTMQLIEKHFSEKYEMPFYLLQEVLTEAGVLEKIEREEEDKAKPMYYPLSEEVVQLAVEAHKAKLAAFNYATGQTSFEDTVNLSSKEPPFISEAVTNPFNYGGRDENKPSTL